MNKFLGFNFTSLMNLFIRTISLGLKFIFVIFLGKYSVDETNLGIYGIFASSISYSLYLVGFEYYIYVSRKIIQKSTESTEYYIKHQLVFYFINYVILFPLILFLLFGYDFISPSFLWVFIIALICEHLGQETFRLLSVFKRPISANITLLLRNIWIIFSLLHYIFLKQIDLYLYFQLWAMFSFVALTVGYFLLLKNIQMKKVIEIKVDYKEIIRGVRVSFLFLIASLSTQTVFLSGRFFLDFFYDKGLVGVYTFFSQFINVIEVVVYNLVVMIIFPHMLETAHTDKNKFIEHVTLFKTKIIKILIICTVGLGLGMPYIVGFLNKPLADENLISFYILLLAAIFYNISLIGHYVLYCYEKDKIILKASLFAVIINLILNYFLTESLGLLGISISYLSAMLFILIFKVYFKSKYYDKNIGH